MNETPSYEMEIPCEEIMETMKKSIYNNFHNYSSSSINKDYISQRLSIFKILQKINMKMGFKSQTYFLSAYYLDILFMKKKKINMNLYKIGLAALCLSAKHCENDPIVPQLQYFVKMYNNAMGYKNIISMSDLMYGEVLLCKLLNYKLNYYSMYDFNSFFFCHGVLKLEQIKEIENDIKNNCFDENEDDCIINTVFVKNILSKIYKKSRYYLDIIIRIHKICFKYSPLFVTILIVKKSIEEVLNAEHKKSNGENYETQADEFCERNRQYFKEIMNDFYKIDFESSEQYKHLIEEDEIKIIFRDKIKSNDKQNKNKELNQVNEIKEIKIKIESKDNTEKMTEKSKDLSNELSNDQIMQLKKEKNNINNNLFNSSLYGGFYKRLELITNENENITNCNNFNFSGRNSINLRNNKIKIEHGPEPDDLENNLNINVIRKSQLLQREGVYITKKINTKPFYRINTYNNFQNANNNMNENKIICNKINEIKNESNSPTNKDKMNSNRILNFKKIIKPKKLKFNSLNEKADNSFNLNMNEINGINENINTYTNTNTYINTYTNTNENIIENINNNNTREKSIKKPYFKKLINLNSKEINNTLGESIKASTATHFYTSKMNNTLPSLNNKFDNSEMNSKNILITESGSNNDINSYTYINSINKRLKFINQKKRSSVNSGNTSMKIRFKKKMKSKIITNNNNISQEMQKVYSITTKDSNAKNNTNINSSKNMENMKSITSENFYPKISVNTKGSSDMKNININQEIKAKRLSYILGKKNYELNNTLKEINRAFKMNFIEENNKNKCNTSRNFETANNKEIRENKDNKDNSHINVNIINKNNKFKKYDMNKIKNKILLGNKNNNNNNFAINVNKNKIISEKTKKLEKIKINFNSNINNSTNINNNSNIINNKVRERFSFKNSINNNSVNNINNGSLTTREYKFKKKDLLQDNTSSIYKIIKKTKNLINKSSNDSDKSNSKKESKNLGSKNFYKSQQNFYKKKDKINYIACNDVIQENTYIKSEINLNKGKINNYPGKKHSSTIIINNNININISNKTKNIKIPQLNLKNAILNTKANYKIDNKHNSQRISNSKNRSSNIGNNHINFNNTNSNTNKKGINHLFNKFPFNKKVSDKLKK